MRPSGLMAIVLLGLCLFLGCEDQTKIPEEEGDNPLASNTIINLYDAFGKPSEDLTKDFGFSALINYQGTIILFDAGTNADVLKNNVEALGLSLTDVDIAVGSHAHGDHLNGFDYLLRVNPDVKLYLPFDLVNGAPISFNVTGKDPGVRDSLPEHMQYFDGQESKYALKLNQSGRFWNANTEYVEKSKMLEEGISLIFTRSPYLGYASKYPSVQELAGSTSTEEDEIKFAGLPEVSLSLSTEHGDVLIVGCSHSSVQNIIQANSEFRESGVAMLYGGYHMLPYGAEEVSAVAKMLKNELLVKKVAPAHCTGHLAFNALRKVYNDNYVFAGLGEAVAF